MSLNVEAFEDNQTYREFSDRAHINAPSGSDGEPPFFRRGSDDSNISDRSAQTVETFGGHTDFVTGNSHLRAVAAMDHPSFQWSHTASAGHGQGNGKGRENSAVAQPEGGRSGQEMVMKPTMGVTTRIMGWDYRANQGASTSSMV
jgi:hypothetical protein